MRGYKALKKILFVCTGNICRSPTAEAVLRARLCAKGKEQDFRIDSAGTHGYHIDEAPDERAVSAALIRGVKMENIRARKVTKEDFKIFDLIVAMDVGHLKILEAMKTENIKADIKLFTNFCSRFQEDDVPDPYYGGKKEFEKMMDIIEDGIEGILETF